MKGGVTMTTTESTSDKVRFMSDRKGRVYYFCNEKCHLTFVGNTPTDMKSKSAKSKGWWERYLERVKNVSCDSTTKVCK